MTHLLKVGRLVNLNTTHFSWPNIYILHVASCYQTFLEVNNKGADQTVPKRRLACAVLFACNIIIISNDEAHKFGEAYTCIYLIPHTKYKM